MNQCSQTKILLMLAADGELDERQSVSLETHVKSCSACRSEQTSFRELDQDLGVYGDLLSRQNQSRPGVPVQIASKRRASAVARMIPVIAGALAAMMLVGMTAIRRPTANSTEEESFIPIPYVQPIDSSESGRTIRMDIPVMALIAVGYHVESADPAAIVKADVLVGEDGRAHAVHVLSELTLN